MKLSIEALMALSFPVVIAIGSYVAYKLKLLR